MAPSSVSTLSNVSLGPVTLPLFKLSHCTVSGHGARMLWTHLPNRDDMFAVFDQVSSRDLGGAVLSKQILKLIRGGELLETIDFDSLRHQARMDRQRAQSQSVPDELLYVIMIVKRPLLALRYRLPDGQIRRLQLNFRPPTGCDTALDFLKPLGIPLRVKSESDPPGPTMQRPYSAQSVITTSPSRSQTSRSTITGPHDEVPPSAQPPVVQSRVTSLQDTNNPDTFSKPISYIRDPRVQQQRPSSGDSASCGYSFLSRPNSLTSSTKPADQPAMKPPPQCKLLPSPTFGKQSSSLGDYYTRPITAPEAQSLSFLTDAVPISQMLPPRRELPFPEQRTSRESHAASLSPGKSAIDQANKQPKGPKKSRATAKSKASLSTSKPRSSAPKAPTRKITAARRGSEKTPAPPPSSAPSRATEPSSNHANKAPPSSAPPETSCTLEALEQTVSKMSRKFTPPSSRSGDTPKSRPISATGNSKVSDRQAQVPCDMPSGRNGETAKKRPLSALEDPEINARQLPPHVLAPQSSPSQQAPRPPNPLLTPISPTEILTSLDHWIRMFHDLPDPNSNAPTEAPSSKAKDQLAVFAGKSEEERARIVDEMVCECLRNENFGTFVDAVEGSWRRVGLGL